MEEKKLEFVAHGQMYSLQIPVIMGIVNCTPDSFLSSSRFNEDMRSNIQQWISGGLDILDVGGQSTRPGATFIDAETEWSRVEPMLQWIRNEYPHQLVSIDTFHPEVARKALALGVQIINDVSAGQWVPGMWDVLKDNNVPYVLMHAKGEPQSMQDRPTYSNVLDEVIAFFQNKKNEIQKIRPGAQIWIDPGFGFGKLFEHNQILLQQLSALSTLNCPILAGVSRKKMIQTALQVSADDSQLGSTLAHMMAVMKGASIIRTHDAMECLTLKKIFNTFN
jgi:dihydropteroate synthase